MTKETLTSDKEELLNENVQTAAPAAEPVSKEDRAELPYQVVIPFNASDRPDRLRLLLASLCAFLQFDFTPVVVSDCPTELAEDDMLVLPFATGCSHNLYGALLTAIRSDKVRECFILMPLTTYLIKPVSLAHIELPKVDVHGDDLTYCLKFPTMFDKQKWTEAQERLEKEEKRVRNVDACLIEYIVKSDVLPMILDWTKDFLLLPVVSPSPNLESVKRFWSNKAAVSIDHDSAFEAIKPLFYDLLPELKQVKKEE